MAAASNNSGSTINEINITPFVDVMLVLLIIFMISTPALVYKGMQINLPKVVNADEISHITLAITMAADGSLELEGRKITLADIKKIFDDIEDNKMVSDAVISADTNVPHGKVMTIADQLKSIGIEQVGFAVLPTKGKAS